VAFDEVFELIKKGVDENKIDQLLKCQVRETGFKRLA